MEVLRGKVWKFGDHISTDLLMPSFTMMGKVREDEMKNFKDNVTNNTTNVSINVISHDLIEHDPVQKSLGQELKMPQRLYRLNMIPDYPWPEVEFRERPPVQVF